jgi:hypothetical protein
MCPQTPRLSPEYSHKAGLQTVITGMLLQIRLVTRGGHAGPVTMGRITRGPSCWTRPHGGTTSSQVFIRFRMGRRVSLPAVLFPLDQRPRRRPRAKGGVFAFAPTSLTRSLSAAATGEQRTLFLVPSASSSAQRSAPVCGLHLHLRCPVLRPGSDRSSLGARLRLSPARICAFVNRVTQIHNPRSSLMSSSPPPVCSGLLGFTRAFVNRCDLRYGSVEIPVLRSPSSLSSLLSSSPPPASGLICASAEIPVLWLTPLRNRDSGVRYGGIGNLLSPSSGLPLLSSPPPVLSGTGTQLRSPSPPPASSVICASAEIPVLRLTPLRLRNRDSSLLSSSYGAPVSLSSLLAPVSLSSLLALVSLSSLLVPVSLSSLLDSVSLSSLLAPVSLSSLLAPVLRIQIRGGTGWPDRSSSPLS